MSGVKIGGAWKIPTTTSVKVGGAWKTASVVSVKVGGAWKTTTLGGAPPPVMTYVTTGVFEVSNTTDGIYTATLVSGAGTATQSTVNGKVRFTLSGANARFAITFAYAVGAPQSVPDYIERKAYTYSCRQEGYECCSGCNCYPVCSGGCSSDSSCGGYGQCGCSGASPWFCGTVSVVCSTCCTTCYREVCDVLISQPGYTNSGTEWYKVD